MASTTPRRRNETYARMLAVAQTRSAAAGRRSSTRPFSAAPSARNSRRWRSRIDAPFAILDCRAGLPLLREAGRLAAGRRRRRFGSRRRGVGTPEGQGRAAGHLETAALAAIDAEQPTPPIDLADRWLSASRLSPGRWKRRQREPRLPSNSNRVFVTLQTWRIVCSASC